MTKWWDNINDLALVAAMRQHCRESDDAFAGDFHSALNSHLIGAARVIGMPEDQIRAACESDRCLTIYKP